jgi:hypothetical protein
MRRKTDFKIQGAGVIFAIRPKYHGSLPIKGRFVNSPIQLLYSRAEPCRAGTLLQATSEGRKIDSEVIKWKRFIEIFFLITSLLSVNHYQPLAELVNCRCSRSSSLASGSGLGSPGRLDDLQGFTERFPSCFLHLFLLVPRLLGASPVSFFCLRCQLEFRYDS